MDNVVQLHEQPASATGRKKASIGTCPSVISLKRQASPRDASLRPAKRLRRCDMEQPAASPSCSMDISLASIQRSIGCFSGSDMANTISTRNRKSQSKTFLVEIPVSGAVLLQLGMAKHGNPEVRPIYLGQWLKHFNVGPTEAAEIAGCDQSYISNIIAGRKKNINALYLLKLSEEFDLNINDFFRPLPNPSHIAAMQDLSPKAQAALLNPKKKQG
jgi:Helix-turn-helix